MLCRDLGQLQKLCAAPVWKDWNFPWQREGVALRMLRADLRKMQGFLI